MRKSKPSLLVGPLLLGLTLPAIGTSAPSDEKDKVTDVTTDEVVKKKGDEEKKVKKVAFYVLEVKGPNWSSARKARAAMKMIDGVDRILVSGKKVTFTLDKDAKIDEEKFKAALKRNKLGFISIEKREGVRAKAAWVLSTPGLTWAKSSGKVREALMKDVPGLTDAFTGPEIILHLREDKPLDLAKLEEILKTHKVKLKGKPKKDASYIL